MIALALFEDVLAVFAGRKFGPRGLIGPPDYSVTRREAIDTKGNEVNRLHLQYPW
jgi:hypothetical protein